MEDLSRYLEQQHPRDLARARGDAGRSVAPRLAERRGLVSHAAGEAAWEWDLESGRIQRGGAMLAITGYGPEEIGFDPAWWKERIHPEDRASVLSAIDAAMVGERRELVMLYRFRRKDGSYALLLDRAFVLGDDPEQPARIVGLAREVTPPVIPPERAPSPVAVEPEEDPPEAGTPSRRLHDSALAFDRITDPALACLPLDVLLSELLDRVRGALRGDAALALLYSEDGALLECRATAGIQAGASGRFSVPARRGVVARVASSGAPILTNDPQAAGGTPPGWVRLCRSFAGAPIVLEARVVGVLCVVARARLEFDEDDRRLLELAADRLGPAFDRARLLESERADRDRLASLSRTIVSSLEEERRRVSRELHDEIGQLLTSLRLTLRSSAPSRVSVDEIMDELFARVRDISTRLRPPMLEDLGLGPALSWHCERFALQTGVRVHLMTTGLERRYPAKAELAVFRVVQEALTNVARHAKVVDARVAVRGTPGTISVLVMDQGVGFPAGSLHEHQSSGLIGMRERARSVGGRLLVSSSPGGGTRVSLRIPIPKGETSPNDEVSS
ncbi:MAG TPA: GAF domain-containing protein [Candidatus Eisenbacteria bacterium]|nr:GAF domain-containing protein [Candidatus Eisenbacteria bacterium]